MSCETPVPTDAYAMSVSSKPTQYIPNMGMNILPNSTISYTTFNAKGVENSTFIMGELYNVTLSHDVFENMSGQESVIVATVQPSGENHSSLTVQNTTFLSSYFNNTIFQISDGHPTANSLAGLTLFWQSYSGLAYYNFTHDSFLNYMVGTGVSHDIVILNNPSHYQISNNLFDQINDNGPKPIIQEPIVSYIDIQSVSYVNITGNYFLGLNNLTKPLDVGQGTHIAVSSNRFFVRPRSPGEIVPGPYSRIVNESGYTFPIVNGTSATFNNPNPVSNLSYWQESIGQGGYNGQTYSYAPDVNTLSAHPMMLQIPGKMI